MKSCITKKTICGSKETTLMDKWTNASLFKTVSIILFCAETLEHVINYYNIVNLQ